MNFVCCRSYGYQLFRPSNLMVDRTKVLECALQQLPNDFNFTGLNVRFIGEEGMCLGPKREFTTLFIQQLIEKESKLFNKVDNEQYRYVRVYCYPHE